MLINADFSRRASLAPDRYDWVASPQCGVERVMLDRVGAEQARATTIVRYAPASSFPHHPHPGGEEILVLSGTFSEGDADYPSGWYLRNPPGSSHAPRSDDGATIFVKLGQMPETRQPRVRINTNDPASWQAMEDKRICPLFSDETEHVCLLQLAALATLPDGDGDGMEVLVLDGALHEAGQVHDAGSWIRLPAGARPAFTAGENGATIYLKTGHLALSILKE